MRWLLKLPVGVLVSAMASVASAQTPILLTISGNEAKGTFELPGGIAGDLSLTFETAVGLNEDALEASVRLVDPLDAGLRSRLPASGGCPQAFPVLIRIAPTPSSGLTIAGIVSISLHTHNLVLAANSPLALYSGPADGPLRDMTRSVGIGSYRAGGSGGGFGYSGGGIEFCLETCVSDASEYMIVADARPIDQVIAEKFQVLESALNGDLTRTNEEVAGLTVDSTRHRAGPPPARRLQRAAAAVHPGPHPVRLGRHHLGHRRGDGPDGLPDDEERGRDLRCLARPGQPVEYRGPTPRRGGHPAVQPGEVPARLSGARADANSVASALPPAVT